MFLLFKYQINISNKWSIFWIFSPPTMLSRSEIRRYFCNDKKINLRKYDKNRVNSVHLLIQKLISWRAKPKKKITKRVKRYLVQHRNQGTWLYVNMFCHWANLIIYVLSLAGMVTWSYHQTCETTALLTKARLTWKSHYSTRPVKYQPRNFLVEHWRVMSASNVRSLT